MKAARYISYGILFVILIILSCSCSSSRIPNNKNRAKKIVERNYKQINAIVSFHNLESPFVTDTLIQIVSPRISGKTAIPTNIERNISSLLSSDYFNNLVFLDPVEKEVVKEKIKEVLVNSRINSVYEDDHIIINMVSDGQSIIVDYNIKEKVFEKEISIKSTTIDAKRTILEEPIFRFLIFITIFILLYKTIENKIKNE